MLGLCVIASTKDCGLTIQVDKFCKISVHMNSSQVSKIELQVLLNYFGISEVLDVDK